MNSSNCEILLFWLVNTSEFLHMIKADCHLVQCEQIGLTNRLYTIIEKIYEFFIECCRVAIRPTLHIFFNIEKNDVTATCKIKFLN